MAGPNRIDLEIGGQDRGALDLLNKLQRETQDLRREVERLSGKPIDLESDPAENDLRRLRAELARLDRAFDAAVRGVSFARIQNELERTTASAKRLERAELRLITRGRQLVEFYKTLPPSLRPVSKELDRMEKETEQAERALLGLKNESGKTGRGLGSLISSINSLRAGIGAFLAALGVQQLVRFSRAIIRVGSDAVETKLAFDKLLPGLKAFTGSTALAEETAARLAATADRLRVPMAGLIDPFNGIVAAGREAGLEIGEISNLFESALVSSRAFGKGASEVQGLLKAIQDVAAKGTASLEEFRRQMGNNIPNAIPALAAGLSEAEGRIVTTSEAVARIASGSLKAADALRALSFGFEKLNAEAAKNQLEKLQADIGGLERAAEKAQVAFGDALEPALRKLVTTTTDLLTKNQDLIAQLGELAGVGLSGVASIAREVGETLEGVRVQQQRLAEGGLFWADVIRKIPGFDKQARSLREVSDTFGFVTAASKEAFERIAVNVEGFAQRGKVSAEEVAAAQERLAERAVKAQKKIAAEGTKTAEQILADFQHSFAEQAKAAGISEDEILEAQKNLAQEVGKIQDELVKKRKALEDSVRENALDNGELTLEDQRRVAEGIVRITRESVAEREALQARGLEDIKKSNAERLRLEEEARQKILVEAEKIVEGARALAEQRIADDEALSDRRQEIEREADEKIVEAKNQFIERLQKPKADREKLEQDLADRVVEIQRDAAEKIRDEEARIAKAAEDAAERRRKAEEKVQEARRKSIEQLVELRERLNEVAAGTDDEGGSALERTKEDVEELDSALGDLIVTLEQLNAGDLGDPLAGLAESGQDLLGGGAAADFFAGLGQGAEEATESVGDFRGALQDALTAAEGLTGGARDAVLDLIARYADLAESGTATRDDFQSFADDLTSIGGQIGSSLDDPVAQVRERIDELRQSQEGAATAAEETARSFEDAGETADVSWDPITKTLATVEEAADDAGDAAEELGIRIEKSSGRITVTNEALNETKEAGETAAEGLEAANEAAGKASESIGATAEALDKLKGEIIGEGEPGKIRELGVAAAEALPQVEPLAAPVQALAGASETLAQALPLIATQLPAIADASKNLLTTLSGTEIDFDAVAKQIGALAPPLEAISTSLPVIQQAVANLPKPITEVLTAAQPLFERALEVAADDRFGKIGVGLASIAGPLPAIPEPAERFQAVLEKIADRREDITGALKAIAEGLAATSAEEILTGLASLVGSLEDIRELIEGIDSATKSWKETLDQIRDDLPELNKQLSELAQKLDTEVVPAMARAKNEAVEVGKEFEGLRQLTETLKTALEEMGNVGEAALKKITSAAVEAAIALRDVAAAAKEATAAAADVQLPEA